MPKPPTALPDHQVTPNPKLEKRTRRQFSTEYKLRILAEADACRHGELGELLRREKLYSSQLTTWRKELAENGVEKLHKTAPGPNPSKTPGSGGPTSSIFCRRTPSYTLRSVAASVIPRQLAKRSSGAFLATP